MEIKKFELQFVERTRDILLKYNGKYSFSNLLNCTLGLIILPYENISSMEIWQKKLNEIDSLPKFDLIKFKPIKSIKKDKEIYFPSTLEIFLKKLRNGLAHQNINPINFEGNLIGVKILNKHINEVDLEVNFTESQLKEFSLFISDLYLAEFKNHDSIKID